MNVWRLPLIIQCAGPWMVLEQFLFCVNGTILIYLCYRNAPRDYLQYRRNSLCISEFLFTFSLLGASALVNQQWCWMNKNTCFKRETCLNKRNAWFMLILMLFSASAVLRSYDKSGTRWACHFVKPTRRWMSKCTNLFLKLKAGKTKAVRPSPGELNVISLTGNLRHPG